MLHQPIDDDVASIHPASIPCLAPRGVEIVDCSSVDDACAALEAGSFDLCLVCLDLPPVPQGGVRLANLVLDVEFPLLLVTRSLRWLPASADSLRSQAWVRPEVDDDALRGAIIAAVSAAAGSWPGATMAEAASMGETMESTELDFDGEFDGDDPQSGARPSFPGIFSLSQEGLVTSDALVDTGLARGSIEPAPLDDEDTDAGLERTSQVG